VEFDISLNSTSFGSRAPLEKVLNELEWDSLATSKWKSLDNILKLLQPFSQYTMLASGEEYTTSSSVIPIVMELNHHLKEMQMIADISKVSTILLSQLKRFAKWTDPEALDHDPIYLVATILDPRYRLLLSDI